jgi:hypothetical protein
LVHFFGDYKVARGMVASIGRTYRYRTPPLSEVVSGTAWTRLLRAGVDRPGLLRIMLWDAANADRAGFLDATLELNLDEPGLWALVTRWADVGSYRRALQGYEAKVVVVPLLSEALDEPSAYEDPALH